MRGVFRFVAEVNSWSIDIIQDELTPQSIASANGIIATGFISSASKQILEASSIPTVFIELESERTINVAHIASNPFEFAREIAEYFLTQGTYKNFIVITQPEAQPFHNACACELCNIFERRGVPCSKVSSESGLRFDRLPLAIFTGNDDLAVKAIHICKRKGLRIPQDAAILGFSNDTVLCENHTPSISSVEPDFELQGYLAARELDRIMSSTRPRQQREIFVDLKQIVERESSALPKAGIGLVRDALTFIKANATRPIGVNDVVKKLKVSRRLVELRFRERNNCSILHSILQHRLEATARELLQSSDSIAMVCERCGWRSENGPKKLFRKTFGMSMRDFRKNKQAEFSAK